ncbi:MAG: hypothetical protein ACK5KR_06450 [Breznakia sp.]
MKKNNHVNHDQDAIVIQDTGEMIKLNDIEKVDVRLQIVQKDAKKTVLNAIANAVSSSIANGNEKVNIFLDIKKKNFDTTSIQLNEKIMVRNNLDYHECVREARALADDIKRLKNMIK